MTSSSKKSRKRPYFLSAINYCTSSRHAISTWPIELPLGLHQHIVNLRSNTIPEIGTYKFKFNMQFYWKALKTPPHITTSIVGCNFFPFRRYSEHPPEHPPLALRPMKKQRNDGVLGDARSTQPGHRTNDDDATTPISVGLLFRSVGPYLYLQWKIRGSISVSVPTTENISIHELTTQA
jgi:hypothetical protein